MDQHKNHEELVKGIGGEMKSVLEKSPQAIYVYLDDNHKVCNKKFAELLGYTSRKEWADLDAPLADVIEEDQQAVIDAYMNASEKMVADARMVIAPVGHAGHIFTAHFFSKI
jgi:PAS domain-containing protein